MGDYYGKRHLIPFAEHVPRWGCRGAEVLSEVVGLHGSWDPAKRATLFETTLSGGDALRFGALVCFEDSFGYLARDYPRPGSDLLINLTNNSWSRRESAQVQHLASGRCGRLRTGRRWCARLTRGCRGLSMPWGGLIRNCRNLPKAVLVSAPIYDNEPLTLYTRGGIVLGTCCCLLRWRCILLPFTGQGWCAPRNLRRRRENGGAS